MKKMMIPVCLLFHMTAFSQKDSTAKPVKDTVAIEAKMPASEPFAFGDFGWLNGNNRQKNTLLDSKYFTGSVTIDVNYTQSNHDPIDNTVVGSTA